MPPEADAGRYLDAVELRRTRRLTVAAPLTAWLLTVALYMVAMPWIPRVWASHVDGEGVVSHAPHWPVALVGVLAAAAAFGAGWLLVWEHTRAGHWHDLEKGIVVAVISAGYGFLAAVLATVLASLGRTPPQEAGSDLIGAGLLGFVVGVIGAIAVHTPALPRARVDRWTPRYCR